MLVMGCGEAVHTLGRLAGTDSSAPSQRNPCRDVGTTVCAEGGVPVEDAAFDLDAGAGAASCEETRTTLSRIEASVFFLVDASPSIVLQPLWGRLTAALAGFAEDPAHVGLGVGVGYYGLACDPAAYQVPAVPILELPGASQQIRSTFPLPLSGKAIVPALRGSYTYLRSVLAGSPLRDVVLILVTDGVLDPLCGSTAEGAAAEARSALEASPRIETRVVALGAGPSLLDPVDLTDLAPLDAIAAAGGTGLAERVQINLLPDDEVRRAVERAVVGAETCAFRAPGPSAASTWLERQAEGALPVRLARVTAPEDCLDGHGYFVRDADPTRAVLCPESCRTMPHGVGGSAVLLDACGE